MAGYNEFTVVMNEHTNPGFESDTMEMSGAQSSTIYSETMYSDERSPLLMCTPTRNYTRKSSVLYVDKAALDQMQHPKAGSRYSYATIASYMYY